MEGVYIMAIIGIGIVFLGYFAIIKNGQNNNKLLQEFEYKMNSNGFTKRIVSYDFFPEQAKPLGIHWFTVGLWLNYPKQLIALRLNRDIWKEITVPFDKIQSVEILEDNCEITTGGAIGYAGLAVGSAETSKFSKGLQVRIVTRDIQTGTKAYFVNLIEQDGVKWKKSNSDYRAIQECARSIADEINNIIHHVM